MLLNHALGIATENFKTSVDTENNELLESMEFMDSYFDMVNAFEDIDSAFDELNKLETAYEEFNNTAEFISENGITKQLAMFIDSENQIISKEEFDELSDIPEKSVALEGKIGDWANKVWEMIKKAYNAVINFFAKMFQSVYRFFANAEKKLNNIVEKLKDKSDADLDKSKIKKAEVKCYSDESSLLVKEFKTDISSKFNTLLDIAEDLKKILETSKDVSEADAKKFIKDGVAKLQRADAEIGVIVNNLKLDHKYTINKNAKIGTNLIEYSVGNSKFQKTENKDLMKAVESVEKYVSYVKDFVKVYKSSNENYKKIKKKFDEFSKDMIKYANKASKEVKKEDEKLLEKLKQRGFSIQALQRKDSRKLIFVPLFSGLFLVISWIIVKLIELSL